MGQKWSKNGQILMTKTGGKNDTKIDAKIGSINLNYSRVNWSNIF
jgi:hypothetical protein